MFLQVMKMLIANFGQVVLGLCERSRRTGGACCRATVGGKVNEELATRGTPTYVCSQLAETCCCRAEKI
jgi:hypothetical protein